MIIRTVFPLALSVVGIWLASATADFRYVPWGNVTAGPYFVIGVVEVFLGGILLSQSLERLNSGLMALSWSGLAVLICLFGELVFWQAAPEEKSLFARQAVGMLSAPPVLVVSWYLLRSSVTSSRFNGRAMLSYGVGVTSVGVAAFLFLAFRQASLSTAGFDLEFEMVQTSLFGVLTLGTVGLLAGIGAFLRSHRND